VTARPPRRPRGAAVAAFLATLLWPGLALVGLALGGAAYAIRRLGPGAPGAPGGGPAEPRLVDVVLALGACLAALSAAVWAAALLTGVDLAARDADLPNLPFLLRDLAVSLAAAGVAAGFVYGRYGRAPADDGLVGRGLAARLALGLAAGAALSLLVVPTDLVAERLLGSPAGGHPLADRLARATTGVDHLVVLASGCLLGPLSEEMFFRAFVFRVVERRLGPAAGLVLSSGLFAAVHVEAAWLPGAFVAGLGLALLYARTRSLPAAAAAHAGINLASLVAARLG
jgi:membrane protease YdiL (CAAX protease family)